MLKIKTIVLTFLSAFSLLFFATPILAGGQRVALREDGDGWVNNNGQYGRVVRIFLHPEFPCKGTKITFKFVDPKEGDFINAATAVMNEDRQPLYKNGVAGTTCSTYAKVGSTSSGDRLFTVDVQNGNSVDSSASVITLHLDGKNYGTGTAEDPYWSMTTAQTPVSMPGAPTMVYPADRQVLDLEGAYMFKVNSVEGASGYLFGLFQDGVMVYENYRDTRTLSANGEFALWESNPAHAKFHEGEVQVWVRAYVRNQWTDARIITINLKPRGGNRVTQPATTQQPIVSTPTPPAFQPTQQIVVVTDSSASAALQKQINELQQKLEVSQQKQSDLEIRLSQIINWIKSIFPFFK